MRDLVQRKIIAILPHYTGQGANFTRVKLLDGEEVLLQKTINSSLKCLCRFYHYDLIASNKTCGEMLNIKKTPPIPINGDIVLIALKTRSPIGKDDGAYSYINIEMIKRIQGETIHFKNGDHMKVSCSHKTIEKGIKQARLLKEMMKTRQILIREKEEAYIKDIESLRIDLEIVYKRFQELEKIIFK